MRNNLLLFYLIILPAFALCQKTESISGHVKTLGDNVNLVNASVLIVRLTDSIIIDHTRTNFQGVFSFSKVPIGKYSLIVSYPEFLTYSSKIDIDNLLPPIKCLFYRTNKKIYFFK